MGDAATQLKAVGAANEELHETAKQALEWVRVSEERVAKAEARSEQVRAELKQRAMAALSRIGEEGRERIAAERSRRKEAEARATRAEAARDRAEKSFEQAQRKAQAEREEIAAELSAARTDSKRKIAAAVKQVEARAAKLHKEELGRAKLEAEIEERVMQGTEDVRREAEERVRSLVEKVEGEAVEKARARAEEALKAESDRIRAQAEQREERVRQAAEEEIKASASRARREALAAAEQTAPSWARQQAAPAGSGYRTF